MWIDDYKFVYNVFEDDGTRCDLHSKFSFYDKKVFFDSMHEGKRFLYMMELEK